MSDILIRNVPPKTAARLKERAKRNGRSVQAEALAILEAGARYNGDELAEKIRRYRAEGKIPHFDLELALQGLWEDRRR
jgi:plasmid stability protein